MADPPLLAGPKVRALRKMLDLSAEACAQMVGINDGAGWRRWERDGAKGVAAVFLTAMIDLPALRRHLQPKD